MQKGRVTSVPVLMWNGCILLELNFNAIVDASCQKCILMLEVLTITIFHMSVRLCRGSQHVLVRGNVCFCQLYLWVHCLLATCSLLKGYKVIVCCIYVENKCYLCMCTLAVSMNSIAMTSEIKNLPTDVNFLHSEFNVFVHLGYMVMVIRSVLPVYRTFTCRLFIAIYCGRSTAVVSDFRRHWCSIPSYIWRLELQQCILIVICVIL